jgi:DNA-binding NarL/FixJ family response regulator
MVRAGFAALLGTQPDFDVLGTAADGAAAVAACRDLRPDVVLMDVRMPGVDGIEATRQLMAGDDPPRVLILTTFDLDEYVFDALRAGASGFLLKDATAERLFDAVRVVAAGDALLAPAVTRRLISEFARIRPPAATPATAAAAAPAALAALTPQAGRRGPVEPGDRRPPGGDRGDGQDPRQPGARQARAARALAGGGSRLRVGPGRAGPRAALAGQAYTTPAARSAAISASG